MHKRGHAVIVGGTRGLGAKLAQAFIAQNMEVSVISRSAETTPTPLNVHRHNLDLMNFRSLDPLVANLRAIAPLTYLIFAQRYRGNDDAWQGEIQVSLTATMRIIEALKDDFSSDGDRAITCVSSVYADAVGGTQPVGYHVCKAGLNQLTRFYAVKLGPRGIRVNAALPMTYLKEEAPVSKHLIAKSYGKLVPIGRMGSITEVANAIEFLSSPQASFVSGQCLTIDGGTSCVWNEELVFPAAEALLPQSSPLERAAT